MAALGNCAMPKAVWCGWTRDAALSRVRTSDCAYEVYVQSLDIPGPYGVPEYRIKPRVCVSA